MGRHLQADAFKVRHSALRLAEVHGAPALAEQQHVVEGAENCADGSTEPASGWVPQRLQQRRSLTFVARLVNDRSDRQAKVRDCAQSVAHVRGTAAVEA